MTKLLSLLLLATFVTASPVDDDDIRDAEVWMVDNAHSAVTFKVKHFFTPVTGRFNEFDVDFMFDPADLDNSSISATIQVGSIETENERRNNHLKTNDFFNAEEFPTMSFVSSSIESTGENQYVANGTLTIRDTSLEIELPFSLLGIAEIPEDMQERMGKRVASFQADASINRNDYGVGTGSWAATAVVGDKVDISILIEAKQN